MRIAIIGSGVSGLVCAHHLRDRHHVTVFEADDRIGGHASTVRVDLPDETHHVDTGFIVYNERNYPVFSRLLGELGVETQPSEMSLSIADERSGLEWGTSAGRIFSQRRNLARPGFLGMIAEIARWNRLGHRLLATPDGDPLASLGEFLTRHRFSRRFRDWYLVPMSAALWSADPSTVDRFPAVTVCRFLQNHGMLSFGDRPAWRTITGGSRRYVAALAAPMATQIHVGAGVEKVVRHTDGIEVRARGREPQTFDRVVMALHSDQALDVLSDADHVERSVIGAIRYQPNTIVLHTDPSVLPSRRKTWASWNVHVPRETGRRVTMTYHMNRLQALESRHELCVTLNRDDAIDPAKVLARFSYEHPIFDGPAVAAQGRRDEVQGRGGVYWCGRVLGVRLPRGRRPFRRSTSRRRSRRAGDQPAHRTRRNSRGIFQLLRREWTGERALRGDTAPPPVRSGRSRVHLPGADGVPRPGRASRRARRPPALVGPTPRCPRSSDDRTSTAIRPFRSTPRSATPSR